MTSLVSPGHQPTARHRIRTRLLAALLSLTALSVLVVGSLGYLSVQNVGESAQRISSQALRDRAEEHLSQTTVGDAQRINLILERVQFDAENTALYATNIFENPTVFTRGEYWRPNEHMFYGPDRQYLNKETDVSSAFVPNTVKVDEALLSDLQLSAYLDFVFAQTLKSNPNTAAIYLGTEREITWYYPNIKLGTLVPPDFKVTQRPWYLSASPKNNPERKAVWSPVYLDATGKGWMVTVAAPVYANGKFIGCLGIDFTLKDVSASVEAARLLGSGYSFLIDKQGRALALPAQGYQDILGRSPKPDEFGTDLVGAVQQFKPVLSQMTNGSTGFTSVKVGGKEWMVAYAPIQSTGWSLGNVVETRVVLQAVGTLQEGLETSTRDLLLARIVPVGGLVLLAMALIGILLARRLTDPIRKVAAAARQIGAGQWDAPLPPTGPDEIGMLAQAVSAMTVELRSLMEGLERRVAERTAETERRANQIATGAEISRAVSQVLDPEELLQRVADLIQQRFNLYYVGVFLVDETARQAVLHAGTGEAGRTMLERGHALEVGGSSMVGWTCANQQARIALDVGAEAVRFANPLLPDTRSEMALPLHIGGRVLGALDIQSVLPQAFDENDIKTLQSMADQIAVALENARLFQQAQASLREVERINRMLTREGWEAFMHTAPPDFAEFHEPGLAPFAPEETDSWAIHDRFSSQDGQVCIPLKVREQVIGTLVVEHAPGQPEWSAADMDLMETVASQAAQAMESARLFEESQRLAGRERMTREITDRIRRAVDMDTLMRVVVQESAAALGTPRVFVQLTAPRERTEDGEALVQPDPSGDRTQLLS